MTEQTNEQYVNLNELSANGEALPFETLEKRALPPVGDYVSQSRSCKAKKFTRLDQKTGEEKEHLSFELTMDGGLTNLATGRLFFAMYPMKKTISTLPYEDEDGNVSTSVGQYLRAFGLKPNTYQTQGELVKAIQGTLQTPCKWYVSRTDKAVKDESGQWQSFRLKLKDFLDPETGKYRDSIQYGGRTVEAKPVLGSCSAL